MTCTCWNIGSHQLWLPNMNSSEKQQLVLMIMLNETIHRSEMNCVPKHQTAAQVKSTESP